MPKYVISDAAQADVRGIFRYTSEKWSEDQAVRYTTALRDCFLTIAQHPAMGRACDSVSEGLRRLELGKHVIFYRTIEKGIRIVRVLHQRMLPAKARFES